MGQKDYKKEYLLKQMELNSLLEITQAINNNMPEPALYKIYDFTIRANLKLEKLALYVYEGIWEAKVSFGVSVDLTQGTPLPSTMEDLKDVKELSGEQPPFDEFDLAIPIMHKNRLLAVVLVASKDHKNEALNTTFLQAISNLIIVAIENKRLARRQLEEESFRKEMEIAKNVQKFLFPDTLPDGVRLKIEASYLPHHNVGGDYYDYIPINKNQFLVCIADVSGKGIPAALMMSNFQASLRTLVRTTSNLTEIVEALNSQIFDNAKGESFITFFGAIYDHELNTMVYVNAGHNPPYIADKDGKLSELDIGTTILGVFDPLPFVSEGFLTDLEGFTMFSYTDGVTETENSLDEEFGSERIEAYLAENHHKRLSDIHRDMLSLLDDFRQDIPYKDDITMLSCRVEAR